jgi:protoheme IX farnesyltransferase
MLPVVKGKPHTRLNILLYALVLFPTGLLPVAVGLGGPLEAAVALLLGGWMVWQAVAVLRESDSQREPAARRLFAVSILYLFALFAALMVERLTGLPPLSAAWV